MLSEGYINLHRSLLKWEWYSDINTTRLFTHLLLVANWKEERWRGIDVLPGQKVTSRDNLSKETGLTVQQVRTSLSKLKSTGEITVTSTSKYSLITINNYDKYQGANPQPNKRATSKQPASNQRVTTIEESNKAIKQEIKTYSARETFSKAVNEYTENEQLRAAIHSFIEMRTKIQKPLTLYALNLALKKLDKFSANVVDKDGYRIQCLEASILNNWRGLFELKGFEDAPPPIVVPQVASRRREIKEGATWADLIESL